eukprot:Filipodium_phascolosomae@DN1135_c0_g1_i1.p1
MGVLLSKGEFIIFLDADGATDINCFDEVWKLRRKDRVVVGSRHHLQESVQAAGTQGRDYLRKFLARGFGWIVGTVLGSDVKDTQCGFKLFSRDAARCIFGSLSLTRWAFDIEVLMLADEYDFGVLEIPVRWVEKPGSKLNVLSASFEMLRDIIWLRLLHTLRVWGPRVPKDLTNDRTASKVQSFPPIFI